MLFPVRWRYPEHDDGRDLRVDFLRGFAMIFVIMYHVGGLSLFYLLAMFGLEVVLGGEVFVLISGVSLGRAQRARIARDGWREASRHLLMRAAQLYLLFVLVALSGWLLSFLPLPAADVLTMYDDGSATPWSMYGRDGSFADVLTGTLLLRYGPWQYGIVAMFVILAALTPLAMWLLTSGRWWLLLGISWGCFALGVMRHLHPFPTVFGGGAPLLTWQIAFAHGLVGGYHRERILHFMYGRAGRAVIAMSFLVGAGLIWFSMNAPWVSDVLWRHLPSWASLNVIPADRFELLRQGIFGTRQWPGVGRLLSIAAAAVVFTTAVTVYWVPIKRVLGWLAIPIGERSLLVFTAQVYVIYAIAQLGVIRPETPLTNTGVQIAAILVLWLIALVWPRTRVARDATSPEPARPVVRAADVRAPAFSDSPTAGMR